MGPSPSESFVEQFDGALRLVERKSGYLLLGKVPNLQAATVRQAAAKRYATTPAALRKPYGLATCDFHILQISQGLGRV
jgi:hypothetical protein